MDVELTPEVVKVIEVVITALVGLFGTGVVAKFTAKIGLDGPYAVVGIYILSGLIGLVALAGAAALFGIEYAWDDVALIASTFSTAGSAAYHRLKDLGRTP